MVRAISEFYEPYEPCDGWGPLQSKVKELARLEASQLDIAERQELEAYREAAQYDCIMEGPRFKGWNRSQLDRARRLTEIGAASRALAFAPLSSDA